MLRRRTIMLSDVLKSKNSTDEPQSTLFPCLAVPPRHARKSVDYRDCNAEVFDGPHTFFSLSFSLSCLYCTFCNFPSGVKIWRAGKTKVVPHSFDDAVLCKFYRRSMVVRAFTRLTPCLGIKLCWWPL